MKYPKKQLLADETIIFDVHHHKVVLIRSLAPALVFLAAWLACLSLVGFFRKGWALLVGALLLAALLGWFCYRLLQWTHANFVLTDRRLVYQSGVLSRRSREIQLSRVTDVSLTQSVPDHLLGGGDLAVLIAGDSRPLPFVSMPRPFKLKAAILQQTHTIAGGTDDLEHRVARAVAKAQPTGEFAPLPPERPPVYSEIVDQIDRLDAMRERGTIDEQEFRRAKQVLLDKLDREPSP